MGMFHKEHGFKVPACSRKYYLHPFMFYYCFSFIRKRRRYQCSLQNKKTVFSLYVINCTIVDSHITVGQNWLKTAESVAVLIFTEMHPSLYSMIYRWCQTSSIVLWTFRLVPARSLNFECEIFPTSDGLKEHPILSRLISVRNTV